VVTQLSGRAVHAAQGKTGATSRRARGTAPTDRRFSWEPPDAASFSEADLRECLSQAGYAAVRLSHPPGNEHPPHTHWYDKIKAVLNGSLEVSVGDETRCLRAGEWIAIPSDREHSMRVIGDEPAVTIEASRS